MGKHLDERLSPDYWAARQADIRADLEASVQSRHPWQWRDALALVKYEEWAGAKRRRAEGWAARRTA